MTQIYDLQQRADVLRKKTATDSISPEEVGGLHADTLAYIANMERYASSLGIKKVYTSVSEMNGDESPVSSTGMPLKAGQLVTIFNAEAPDAENSGEIYAFQNPGWLLAGRLDSGNYSRLSNIVRGETGYISDNIRSPYTFIGNFATWAEVQTELDKLHNSDGGADNKVIGEFRVLLDGRNLLVRNWVQNWATGVFTQTVEGSVRWNGETMEQSLQIATYERRYNEGSGWGEWKSVETSGGNMILDWKTNAATTRKQVPQDERKAGMMISYRNASGEWINEQYVGMSFDDTSWAADANWQQIGASAIELAQELSTEEGSEKKAISQKAVSEAINNVNNVIVLEWATNVNTTRKQVPQSNRKAGMIISYKPTDSDWLNEQYVNSIFSDTEWTNNVNWRRIPNDKDIYKLKYKNVDLTWEGKLIGASFELAAYGTSGHSQFIPVIPGSYIYVRNDSITGYGYKSLVFYTSKDLSNYMADSAITMDRKIDEYIKVPEGANYMVLSRLSNSTECIVGLPFDIQKDTVLNDEILKNKSLDIIDESDTTFGFLWKELENLVFTGGYINIDGSKGLYSGNVISNFIYLEQRRFYVKAVAPLYVNSLSVAFYSEADYSTFISGIKAKDIDDIISAPDGANYVIITSKLNSGATLYFKDNIIENSIAYNVKKQVDTIKKYSVKSDYTPLLNLYGGSINVNNGSISLNYGLAQWMCTGYIPLKNVASIKFNVYLPTQNIGLWATYDSEYRLVRLQKETSAGWKSGIISDFGENESYICIGTASFFNIGNEEQDSLLEIFLKDFTKPLFQNDRFHLISWDKTKDASIFTSSDVTTNEEGYIVLDNSNDVIIEGFHSTMTNYSLKCIVDDTSIINLSLHGMVFTVDLVSKLFKMGTDKEISIPEGFVLDSIIAITIDGYNTQTRGMLINQKGEIISLEKDSSGTNFTSKMSVTGACKLIDFKLRVPKIDTMFYGDSQTAGSMGGGITAKDSTQALYQKYTNKVMAWNAQGSRNLVSMFKDIQYLILIKPEFVVFTFGTNQGTQDTVLYQQYCTIIPILQTFGINVVVNHIPNNKSYGNAPVINSAIENVIHDVCVIKESGRYDLATSINGNVDNGCDMTVMPDGLHPNIEGHQRQFNRLLIDVPSLFV